MFAYLGFSGLSGAYDRIFGCKGYRWQCHLFLKWQRIQRHVRIEMLVYLGGGMIPVSGALQAGPLG